MEIREVDIDSIKVGDRLRKDPGNIEALAQSIKERGLTRLPVVTPDHDLVLNLVLGWRELLACKLLGWTRISVLVMDVSDPLRAQLADNAFQKPPSPSEQVTIARLLFKEELAAAKARRLSKLRRGQAVPEGESFPDGKGRTWDLLGKVVGTSGKSLEKKVFVVEKAEGDEQFRYLVDQMDRTGKVDGAYRVLMDHRRYPERFEPNAAGHLVPRVVERTEGDIIAEGRRLTDRLVRFVKAALRRLSEDGQQQLLGEMLGLVCEGFAAWGKAKGLGPGEVKDKLHTYIDGYPF